MKRIGFVFNSFGSFIYFCHTSLTLNLLIDSFPRFYQQLNLRGEGGMNGLN